MKKGNAQAKGFCRMHPDKRLVNVLREKSSILASQRRMERKLKELNATLDQERIQHVEQRDQVPVLSRYAHLSEQSEIGMVHPVRSRAGATLPKRPHFRSH